jgi:hypothetical protein
MRARGTSRDITPLKMEKSSLFIFRGSILKVDKV